MPEHIELFYSGNHEKYQIAIRFCPGGLSNLYQDWFSGKLTCSLAELTLIGDALILRIIGHLNASCAASPEQGHLRSSGLSCLRRRFHRNIDACCDPLPFRRTGICCHLVCGDHLQFRGILPGHTGMGHDLRLVRNLRTGSDCRADPADSQHLCHTGCIPGYPAGRPVIMRKKSSSGDDSEEDFSVSILQASVCCWFQ